MRFRQSEVATWDECRRRHSFQYTHNVAPIYIGARQPTKGQREAGSAAHVGVEHLNNGESLADALVAVGKYIQDLREWRLPEGHELPPLTKEDDKKWWEVQRLALAITANYQDWVKDNEPGVSFSWIEQDWEFAVPGTESTLYGKVDAVIFDPLIQGHVVRDYKSVSSFDQTPEDVDFQLRTYAWAWWKMSGIVPKRAEHLMMKRVLGTKAAKPPFFQRHAIPITLRILQAHEEILAARLREMESSASLPTDSPVLWPSPSKDCSWKCDYRDVCPMVDDGSDWEYMLESSFTEREYNE